MTELAATYGVSRKTAYYWVRLVERDGPGRLAGASRRPHTSPQATPREVVDQLLAARRRHPTWGAGKLRDWLVRQTPAIGWPCRDTIPTILGRAGLVRHRRHRGPGVHPPPHLTVPTHPNALWTVDYKGEFRTGDGVLCYPLTLRDGYSRYVLRCAALTTRQRAETQAHFVRAFTLDGLPDRLRSDNGPPFAAPGLGRLSRLAVWWLRLGIHVERIAPGHPEQNGSHEQFHAVLHRDTARPPAATRAAQQRRFARFVTEYNEERPHDAVDHAPPVTRYVASPRPFPTRLPPLEYPREWEVRCVSPSGQIKWHGRRLFLSGALAQQPVALQPIDDGRWLLRFASMALGIFDERLWRLLPASHAAPSTAPPVIEGAAPGADDR